MSCIFEVLNSIVSWKPSQLRPRESRMEPIFDILLRVGNIVRNYYEKLFRIQFYSLVTSFNAKIVF
jgi:hypothetical protein